MAGIEKVKRGSFFGYWAGLILLSGILLAALTGCDNPLQGYIDTYLYGEPYNLEVAKLVIDGAANYGFSVAIDGDYMVVGAPAEWDNTTHDEAVYVYHRKSIDAWDAGVKLQPPDWKAGDNFGFSVAIKGDFIAIGAPFKEVVDSTGTAQSAAGAVYIYKRTGTNSWELDSEITKKDQWSTAFGYDAVDHDLFGYSLDMEGSWLFIGAPQDDLGGGLSDNYGAVFVFKYSGNWVFEEGLTAKQDKKINAHFGRSIDAYSDTLVVGASFEGIGGNSRVGAVYTFGFVVDGWVNKERITSPDGEAMDYFGESVSVTNDFLAVGAPVKTMGGKSFAGKVYVFVKSDAGSWNTQPAEFTLTDPNDNDMYGLAVAISGDVLIAGSLLRDNGDTADTGAAYLYKNATGTNTWELQKTLIPSDAVTGSYFGKSIAIGDTYTIIGAAHYADYTTNGSIYIFR